MQLWPATIASSPRGICSWFLYWQGAFTAEGAHRPSFWQKEGLRAPFFVGPARLLGRHRHGTHDKHGSYA